MIDEFGDGSDEVTLALRATADTSASTTCAKPAGVAVGDLVVVVVPDAGVNNLTLTTGGGGGAWSRDYVFVTAHGYHATIFARVLNATDVAQAWTFSASVNARALAWVGDEFDSVSIKAGVANGLGQAILTLPGFTPANTRAVVSVCVDRDGGLTPGTPAGFVSRSSAALSAWVIAAADSDGYGGANVVWTGLDASADDFADEGWLIEVKQS